jgi:hypothetical protein
MSLLNNFGVDLPQLPTAPPDPVMQGARGERRMNYNSALGYILMRQSHMPMGRHAGKIMQNVPADYLLEIYRDYDTLDHADLWLWRFVYDYICRDLEFIQLRAESQTPSADMPYVKRFDGTLVDLQQAAIRYEAKYRCELCHDSPSESCLCNPQRRYERNLARIEVQAQRARRNLLSSPVTRRVRRTDAMMCE